MKKKIPVKSRGNEKMSARKSIATIVLLCVIFLIGIALFHFMELKSELGLSAWEMYQNLANPSVRYVKITEGMRKEEVADRFATTLGWSSDEKQKLIQTYTKITQGASEGYYFPDTYLIPIGAKAQDVSQTIYNTFTKEVIQKESKLNKNIINIDTAIKIASIIQREAGSKNDMKIISGVIWNRLFDGMSLDMDATLQYAKGSQGQWWPIVVPDDKNINSPYNTYKNTGLPPSAISNPGTAAIDAALNPSTTKALFYIHDKNHQIHTATTYEQHLANIARYY